MYSIRFNPVLYLGAIVIAFISGQKFLKYLGSDHVIRLFTHGGFFILAVIILIALLTRRHIIIDDTSLYIRESCLRGPRIMKLSEIVEANFGVQRWGFWTRGRKLLSIKMKDGDELHFFSASFLTARSKESLAHRLRSVGINVSID